MDTILDTGTIAYDWEPPSLKEARDGDKAAQNGLYAAGELAATVQAACKVATGLCEGSWLTTREAMRMSDQMVQVSDRARPTWVAEEPMFYKRPPPPREVSTFDLGLPGAVYTKLSQRAVITVGVIIGWGTATLTMECTGQRTAEGATKTSFTAHELAHAAVFTVPARCGFSVTRSGQEPPHVEIPAGGRLDGQCGIPIDPNEWPAAAAWVSYANLRDPPGEGKDLTLILFEFDDIGRFAIPSKGERWTYTGDCGPCYPLIPSAVGPVYSPRNQDGNPPNSNGDGLIGSFWEPRHEHRARAHFAAVNNNPNNRDGWGGWVWPQPYSWWCVPTNMDQSTPLDASQLQGLTPPSYMYAFRAWTPVESAAWDIPTDFRPSPGDDLHDLYEVDPPETSKKRKATTGHVPRKVAFSC